MKNLIYSILLLTIVMICACGGSNDNSQTAESNAPKVQTFADDSTIYGLACDGCSDSVVLLLPFDGSDPVKFNVVNAYRKNKVHGKLRVGDRIAIVANTKDSTIADMVIDLEQLQDTWCYTVMPRLKMPEGATEAQKKKLLESISDSIKEAYFVPREYGFNLKSHNLASPIGQVRQSSVLEDESPVEYDEVPQYTEWHILNGQLVLSRPITANTDGMEEALIADSLATMKNDTADILFMQEDSLILQFGEHKQSYYRVKNSDDANKLARSKAEQNAREATKNLSKEDVSNKEIVKKTDSKE